MRIAVAGLQHETNTFAGGVTGRAAFEAPGGWPRLTFGADVLGAIDGTSVPLAGALPALAEAGAEAVPLLWGMALPSGPVEHATFRAFVDAITGGIAAAGEIDGVLLELHGAMVTTEEEDAEGALLEAVRAVLPPDVPLVATLDLHANLTARMVAAADLLEVYRTYPHVDMAETGARAARAVVAFAGGAPRPAAAFREIPFLIPLIAQATERPAVAELYAAARADEMEGTALLSLTMGFPHADIAVAGPALAVYAAERDTAERLADRHLALWTKAESALTADVLAPGAAVAQARALCGPFGAGGPVILADVQDNPGGGGSQDTTGLLHALISSGAEGAVLVHLCDPPAAEAAHAAGAGASLPIALGAARAPHHGAPVPGPWIVRALGDGAFTGEGRMYRGNRIALGPVGLLEKNGVRCIVAGTRMQASEPGLLRHLSLVPEEIPILALKSSVHFRGAYQEMAAEILHVAAPGDVPADLTTLPYRRATRRIAGQSQTTIPTGETT